VLASLAVLAVLATGALAASPPVITSVSPDSGPLDGGGTVTITGANFTTVSAVDFGTAAGKGLTVVSEHEITVTPPFGDGVVDVTVHAAAGTSALTPADEFHYELSSGSLSWGRDSSGELGIGEAGSRVATLPVEVKNLS
jgi:IPT/TIG domain-containing protein